MDKFKKFFSGKVEKIDVHIDGGHLIEDKVKAVQELEDLYKEIECSTDEYSDGDFISQLSSEEQENHDYWEGADKSREKTYRNAGILTNSYAENVAAEDDYEMNRLDDLGRNDVIGGGKTQRMIDAKQRWLDADEESQDPFIENENPHTAPEDLTDEEREEANSLRKTSEKIVKKLRKKGILPKQESGKVSVDTVPANLPVETVEEVVVEQPRVKPEVKVELEKVEKPMNELEKFKLMKEVVAFNILVGTGSKIDELRPVRGDTPLSLDEISATMKAFRTKKEKGQEEISPLEQEFFDHCQAWIWAVQKIEGYKGNDPKYPNGQILSREERNVLQKEYFTIKGDENNFARLNGLLNLETIGDKKVASGEWKKGEFAWKEEKGEKGSRWYAVKGADLYYTYSDPKEILGDNQSAEFFYTVTKQEVIGKGEKLFISIKFPKQEKVLA